MKRLITTLCLLLASFGAYANQCIPSGVVDQYTYFVAVDSTDFTTRETGLATWTVYRSRNGAAAAVFTTPTINETSSANMPGVYELLLDEDMSIDAGDDVQHMTVHVTHAGMAPVTKEFCIARAKITAGETVTASGGNANSSVQAMATDVITSTAIATNAIGAAEVADDAIGAAEAGFLTDSTGFAGASVAVIAADTTTDIPAQISALNNISTAQVNAEVVDALATDTYAEPGVGTPAATASLSAKLNYLYKGWRNRSTQTATTWTLYNDDATTAAQQSTVSDNGTTFDKTEVVTP